MSRITKEAIVNFIMEKYDINTKKGAQDKLKDSIELITSCIEESLINDTIQLSPLGSFKIRKSKEREGRDPSNHKPIKIKSKVNIKFVPSATVKRSLQNKLK